MIKVLPTTSPVASASEVDPSAAGEVLEPALPAVVATAFGRLNNRLRARLLRRLLTSVGPLALTVVSGGAFAKYIKHARWPEIPVSIEDTTRLTATQVYELARYVQQADPQVFGQVLDALAHNAATVACVSASIAALTINRLSSSGRKQRGASSRAESGAARSSPGQAPPPSARRRAGRRTGPRDP